MNIRKPQPISETRQQILNVAERLFADHGLQGVSIRDITREANVNLGAINYYFGTKQQLIAAVFERRLAPIGEERLASLDAVENAAGAGAPTLEAVLEAFIRPAVRQALDEPHGTAQFRKLMGRCFHEPNAELDVVLHKHFDPVRQRFDAALSRAMPGLSREDVFWRMHLTLGVLHHSLMMLDRQPPGLPPIQLDVESLVKRLVAFCAAGFRAAIAQ